MSKKFPLISILICNYNYEAFILDSLNSAIDQDYPNIEIIVIDDGSTDSSVLKIETLIKENTKRKIVLNVNIKNEGLCYARNNAIMAAKGEYFIFLDSDDVLPSNYASNLYETAHIENADVVYGNVKRFGAESSESDEPDYDPKKLLIDNYVNISSLVKKSKIKTHKFDILLNRKSHEDYDFWVGLSLMGLKFEKSKNTYLHYRIQDQSRNGNTQDFTSRSLEHIKAWKYIIEKYRKQFNIDDGIIYDQMSYQIRRISSELIKLNNVIHEELNPELRKRELHIFNQNNLIKKQSVIVDAQNTHNKELEYELSRIVGSKDYRIGHAILKVIRAVRRLIKL